MRPQKEDSKFNKYNFIVKKYYLGNKEGNRHHTQNTLKNKESRIRHIYLYHIQKQKNIMAMFLNI